MLIILQALVRFIYKEYLFKIITAKKIKQKNSIPNFKSNEKTFISNNIYFIIKLQF